MKKVIVISFVLIYCFGCNEPVKGPNGITYKSLVDYNDYIVERQSMLLNKVTEFSDLAKKDLDSAKNKIDTYVENAEDIINDIKGMPPYKNDSAFRDAAVVSFQFFKKTFDKHYRDIIDIRNEEPIDADGKIDKIIEEITIEGEKSDVGFINAQRNFAKKNNMKLIEDKKL